MSKPSGIIRTVLAAALLLVAVPASADHHGERSYPLDVSHKLARGVANIFWAPVEIPVNIYKESVRAADGRTGWGQRGNAFFKGLFDGIGFMAARYVVGVVDIVSFPVPTPPIMQPSAPHSLADTVGHGGREGIFSVQGRYSKNPHKSRLDWKKDGADDEDYYHDRFDCARRTLYNGYFDDCMEDLDWSRKYDPGF